MGFDVEAAAVSERPYPTFRQAIGLLGLLVLAQIVGSIPLFLIFEALSINFLENPAGIGALNLLSFGFVLHWGARQAGVPLSELFPLQPVRALLLAPMALSVIGLSAVLSEVDNLVRLVLPMPAAIAALFSELMGGTHNLAGAILALVIIAPLTEELLFRGLMLRGFLRHSPAWRAVLASALLFALIHLNPWQVPGAVVLGALFGWWYVRTGSLVPCLFGHALANGLPLIYTTLLRVRIPGYTTEFTPHVEHQPLWFTLLGVALAGGAIWVTARWLPVGDATLPS